MTNDACTPNSVHYAYDTYALARGTGAALMKTGGTSWYFLTADYAFGHALEADTSAIVKAMGGQVVGSTRYPPDALDQSSFLLKAQSSQAKVVALAGSGTVFVNAVKSAHEFGIDADGQIAKKSPEAFVAIAARICPNDVRLTLEQAIPGGMSLADYSLMREVIAAIREGLPKADQMQPGLEALHDCSKKSQNTNSSICSDQIRE